jgi:hypothetical protein
MYNDKKIEDIAVRIAADPIEVQYTENGKPNHVFKKGTDIIRVFDNPNAVKRFTAVVFGKGWEDGDVHTVIRFNDGRAFNFGTDKISPKLGKPVVWTSLPEELRKKILTQLSGKWE